MEESKIVNKRLQGDEVDENTNVEHSSKRIKKTINCLSEKDVGILAYLVLFLYYTKIHF